MSGETPLLEGRVDERLLQGTAHRVWGRMRRSARSPRLRAAARLAKRVLRPLRPHAELS